MNSIKECGRKASRKMGLKNFKNTTVIVKVLKSRNLMFFFNEISNACEADRMLVENYKSILNEVEEREFAESFGEFKLYILKMAIEKQEIGFEAYIKKKWMVEK